MVKVVSIFSVSVVAHPPSPLGIHIGYQLCMGEAVVGHDNVYACPICVGWLRSVEVGHCNLSGAMNDGVCFASCSSWGRLTPNERRDLFEKLR